MSKAKIIKKPTKAAADKASAIIIRECMEANQVLPPEKAVKSAAVTPEQGKADTLAMDGIGRTELGEHMDEACAAGILTAQYWKACNGTVEMIRFGAMLMQVETGISRVRIRGENGQFDGQDSGLKTWLENHCPEVNYQTAMRFKNLAADVKRHCKIPDTLPMDKVLPAANGWVPVAERRKWVSKDRVSELQKMVFELVEGKSARQLSFELRLFDEKAKGGARDGAGRPKLEASAETRAGAAWGLIGREIDRATAWRFERFLPEAMVREALSTVDLLRDALKARLNEF